MPRYTGGQAIINYLIALVELYLAEGSLLERRGIQVLEQVDDRVY